MHIAIDARFLNSSTGTYGVKLLNHLQQIDTTNNYSVLVWPKDLDYWKPTNANFTVVAADYDYYSFAEQIGLKFFLDKLKPDLVHFLMPQQPLLYKGRTVTTMHDLNLLKTYNSDKNWLIFHFKQLVGRFVFKRIATMSDHVIAITENTKREYQEFSHIPDTKISVIYEAAEIYQGELTPVEVPFDEFIMYVGQQPDYKNIRRLAEAHQLLLEKHPNLGLILVGRLNPDAQKNKALFEKLGYRNIYFTGFLPDDQRDWLFTQARAYVFPSLMEGFGLPPLEAMGYGTPVISSNATCLPEVLGDAAEYFDPLDVPAMAAAIEKVITDDDLRFGMIARGHAQVAKYSWGKTAKETHQVYMNILKSKPL